MGGSYILLAMLNSAVMAGFRFVHFTPPQVGGTMIRTIRHMGMALGSLVAAWLVVGLIGGVLLPGLGFTSTALPTLPGPGAHTTITLAGSVVTVVLGGLIYRDLVRREQQSS